MPWERLIAGAAMIQLSPLSNYQHSIQIGCDLIPEVIVDERKQTMDAEPALASCRENVR